MEKSKLNEPIILDSLKTLLIFIVATIISFYFYKYTEATTSVLMSYILATILISRITTGYIYGIVASILSVIVSNYLFIYFLHTMDVPRKDLPLTFIGLLLISLITSTTTAHLKQHARLADIREEKTKKLFEINEKLLTTRGIENIIDLALEFVVSLTERSAIFYEGDSQSGKNTVIRSKNEEHTRILRSYHETFIAHWVFEHGECAGAGAPRSIKSSAIYFPIIAHDKTLGVIGVFCGYKHLLEPEMITFLKLMISQIAMAIERQNLSDNQRLLAIESEKEKTRSNLLRAVSHDLRTPLTGMIGASNILIENKDTLSESEKDTLIRHIKEDSNWLLHMVENLLSVTRIREGATAVTKMPEPLEEVVSEVIGRIKNRYHDAQIQVQVPEEFLMVPMDATLIEQVMLNLIENSIKYSQSEKPVELWVTKEENEVVFHVMDEGIGLREDEIGTIFDGYSMNRNRSADTAKGMGIGLSICKTIINAHGGSITAQNREHGGAMFTFTLPLEGDSPNES